MTEVRLRNSEKIEAVLDDPTIYKIGTEMPTPQRILGGRTRVHPGWVYVFFRQMAVFFGSERRAGDEIADPTIWDRVVAAGERRFPTQPEMHAPETPMTRGQYRWGKQHHLTTDEFLEKVSAIQRDDAVEKAVEMGIMTGHEGSLTRPARENVAYGDGKVVKARFKDPKGRRKVNKSTGEITEPKIVDPDAAEHTTGAGDKVYGLNFVMYHGRNSNENERLILGVAHAPKAGGEAKWAAQAADDIIRRYPEMQALAYDGAFRGTHIRKIQTTHGVPVAVPIQRRNGKPGDHDYEAVAEVCRPDGTKETVRLHLVEGHPHLKTVNNLGDLLLVPLVHEKTARTQREDGTWRLYLTFSVPDQNGGGTIRVRLDQTAEDRARTDTAGKSKPFNREEHLRAFTRLSPTWATVYHLRPEAESHHRKLDDSLIREWAPSVGQHGQTWDMVMWAVTQNALAIAYRRKRKRLQDSG